MISDIVAVTDHLKDFTIEENLLGDYFDYKLSKKPQLL